MKLQCVLCEKDAVTTAGHIPVCEDHHREYIHEGKLYLPEARRVFWERLQEAGSRKKSNVSSD